MRNLALFLVLIMVSASAMASVVGLSTHPLTMKRSAMNTEFNSYGASKDGKGFNARYHQRINEAMNFDVGAGFTDGERSNQFFAGVDTQLIPDYGRQPRISVKALGSTQNVDGERVYSLGAAPIISKGFAVSGNEMFPYMAVPLELVLNDDSSKWVTSSAVALGTTMRLPWDGYENLVANAEINMSLRNSYSAIVLGISIPIN